MALSDELALQIYQSILDATGDAVTLGDFNRYHPFFTRPSIVENFEMRFSIDTLEELQAIFEKVLAGLRTAGAVRMARTCSVAQFANSDTIRGVHETRLLNADGEVVDAYTGMCTLSLVDGHWRVALSQFVEETRSLPSRTLGDFAEASSQKTD